MKNDHDSHVLKYKFRSFPFNIFFFAIAFFFCFGLFIGIIYSQWQSDNIYRSLLQYKFTEGRSAPN